jgi:two-component system chemotaxis response regulator CheV
MDSSDRSGIAGANQFEMLLFRLGSADGVSPSELYGINVFKIREIAPMMPITEMIGSMPNMLGVVNLRGQVIPVIDLPAVVGCTPKSGLNILLITEFARHTQAFAVEAVEDIVCLDWSQVLAAEANAGNGMVTSIARLDGDVNSPRLAQVLDVEAITRSMSPEHYDVRETKLTALPIKPGSIILAADDSAVARSIIDEGLRSLGAEAILARTGKEAWERLQGLARQAEAEGCSVADKIALVLTDLEMPEMDGFSLTRNIKTHPKLQSLPVVIYSSLTGTATEQHAKSVGADAYVSKFHMDDLAHTLHDVLQARSPAVA